MNMSLSLQPVYAILTKIFLSGVRGDGGRTCDLSQHGETGGPRATTGPRQLVTRKLFVNFLLLNTSSSILLLRRI
jgi:hypothetical protein